MFTVHNNKQTWRNVNCSRFKNVIFDIVPGSETGSFNVKTRFLGVEMEEFLLKYQVEPEPGDILR